MVIMQFYLVFRGRLPSTGNTSKKPDIVRDIRDQFHPQLELLWKTSAALQRLKRTAWVAENPATRMATVDSPLGPEWDVDKYPPKEGYVDLCAPIVKGKKSYIPLVRKSLDLNCHLQILFLRQEDPGALVLQGGDLDGRIKTLFDALRAPDEDVELLHPQAQVKTFCLMENDTLISGFEVSTGRLLMPETEFPNEAHLIVEVTIRVLKLGSWNVCLAGD